MNGGLKDELLATSTTHTNESLKLTQEDVDKMIQAVQSAQPVLTEVRGGDYALEKLKQELVEQVLTDDKEKLSDGMLSQFYGVPVILDPTLPTNIIKLIHADGSERFIVFKIPV